MDHAGNSTTLYEDKSLLLYPTKLVFIKNITSYQDLVNSSLWLVEKCMETFYTNKTVHFSIKNSLFRYNNTPIACVEHAPVLTKSAIIKFSVLIVITILSLFGNLATIISIHRGKKKRGRERLHCSAMYSLIFQLSIADLLVTIFCIAGEASWSLTVEWYVGNILCKIYKYVQMFALYLSTFVLVLIGVDRWLAIKYPLKSIDTATRSRRLVIIAWVLSAVLSIPQLFIFRVVRAHTFEEFYQCATYGFYTQPWQEATYMTITFLVMFILPLGILVPTYVSTVRTIAQEQKFGPAVRRPDDNHCMTVVYDNRNEKLRKAKIRSLQMSVVIVAAFLIWWTPYHVMWMIFVFWNPDEDLTGNLLNGIFFFGMSNSLVNPVIYGAFHLWPKRSKRRHNNRESFGLQASSLRSGEMNSCSMRQNMRYSTKYSNVNNISLL